MNGNLKSPLSHLKGDFKLPILAQPDPSFHELFWCHVPETAINAAKRVDYVA